MTDSEIVKVQRPLSPVGSAEDEMLLIYNEGRKHSALQPLTLAIETLMGADMKAFFYATRLSNGHWQIGDRAPGQSW